MDCTGQQHAARCKTTEDQPADRSDRRWSLHQANARSVLGVSMSRHDCEHHWGELRGRDRRGHSMHAAVHRGRSALQANAHRAFCGDWPVRSTVNGFELGGEVTRREK